MPCRQRKSYQTNRRVDVCLNTGSALSSRQEVTPASAEVGPSTASTPSVSLRGDAESAEVSSSLIGQPIMDTRGSVVPSQPILVEPRINKRRNRSSSKTSCSVILYIHSPVHIYGVTYYSTTTTSDVVVAYNTSGPWNLMLSGHANY